MLQFLERPLEAGGSVDCRLHSGAVVSAPASQQEGSWSKARLGDLRDRSLEMIGRILFSLLGNTGDDSAEDSCDQLTEMEDEGWVVINLPENVGASAPEADPLENLLIEHPSMSVYQMRSREESELPTDEEEEEEEEDVSRPAAVAWRSSWHLAGSGILLAWSEPPLAVQRAWSQADRKKLSRSALHRQNLARVRFSAGERRYGHFKQPCQRLYNY